MKTKILMIEDSSIIHKSLGLSLELTFTDNLNLPAPEVTIVTTEKEAMEADQDSFDIITLDGQLPDGHGIEVLKAMKPENKKKVIGLSTDKFFVDFCKENGIPALPKEDALPENLAPLIKNILG